MNKKSVIIILVVCIVFIGGVAAIALTSQGSWGGWFFFGGERVEVDEGSDLNLEGVTEVTVSLPFGETIVEAGEPGVTLKGHFTTSSKKDQYLYVEKDGGRLVVKFDPGNLPFIHESNIHMTVRLPEEIAARLAVRNSSGAIDVTGITAKDMDITNSSGTVDITDCKGEKLDLNLSSGNTNVNGAEFGGMKITCQSGNIRIDDAAGDLEARNSSGNIIANNIVGSVKARNSSGNINLDLPSKQLSAVDVNISSGNATLTLDPEAAFTLDANTSSGNVTTDFDVLISGGLSRGALKGECNGGGKTVKLAVSSGNVNILKR